MCHQTSSLCLCFCKLVPGLAFIVLLNVPLYGDAPADATKKVVVADSASLEKSTKVVNDLYGDDFKKAITPAMKSALAQKLLQEGEAEKSDMAAKYVLLKDAAEQAAAGGYHDRGCGDL
jgi:hypothetical protein